MQRRTDGPIYPVGSIVAAWVTFGTLTLNSDWSWRIPIVIIATKHLHKVLSPDLWLLVAPSGSSSFSAELAVVVP